MIYFRCTILGACCCSTERGEGDGASAWVVVFDDPNENAQKPGLASFVDGLRLFLLWSIVFLVDVVESAGRKACNLSEDGGGDESKAAGVVDEASTSPAQDSGYRRAERGLVCGVLCPPSSLLTSFESSPFGRGT
jgi:hypothetical protein